MCIKFVNSSKFTENGFLKIAKVPFIALALYCLVWSVNWTLQTTAKLILLSKASSADQFIVTRGLGYWNINDLLNYVAKGVVLEAKMKITDELITIWIYPCLLFMSLFLSALKQYGKTYYSYDKLKKHGGESELFSIRDTHQQ